MMRHLTPLTGLFLLLLFSASRPNVIPLTVTFSGLEQVRGQIMVRLQDAQGRAVKNITHPVTKLPPRIEVQLPPGRYALAAYHDENGNGKLDRAWNGMPEEAYGFSNGLRGSILGPPDLEDQLFSLQKARALEIQLQ